MGSRANLTANSGLLEKDDGTTLSQADVLADVYDSGNHYLKIGGAVTGTVSLTKYPDATPVTQDSTANTLNTLTIAGVATKCHYLVAFSCSISGAATGAVVTITVKDGNTAKWKIAIPSGAAIGTTKDIYFNAPLTISTAADLVITASQAGAASITTLNALYYDA